jgi:pimeloyl-ACP methyl ester carboxylesterase
MKRHEDEEIMTLRRRERGVDDKRPAALTRSDLVSAGAQVAVHRTGDAGPPLLLIHSINAAASADEVEPLRARYSSTRRVYCIDLPGFGESDRSDRVYSARLMTDAIVRAADEISAMAGKPIDALAVSLSCEFLARAASENPSTFRSIAFVSPTGFTGVKALRAPAGETRGKAWLYKLLRGPGWGAALYRQLTRPKVIRYFLERTWGSKNIDEGLWRVDVLMSRYPGAHFAPLYFLSALLFSADIHNVYDSIRIPVWVSHGQRGDFVDYRQLPTLAERNHWRVAVFNTGAMVYFEELNAFADEYDRFLAQM